MRLLENKEFPRLKINASGRVLYMNMSARKSLWELEIGQSIFDIIEADFIRKLSMHKKKLELVETKLKNFPLALLKITEKTRTKSIEIIFYPTGVIIDNIYMDAKRVIELYSDKNTPKTNTCIDILDSLKCIFDELSKRKELFGIDTKIEAENSFYAKLGQPQAELLFLATALVASEINPNGTLEIKVNNGIVELSLETTDRYIANSVTELLYLYPQLAPRLLLIDSLCEDEFIKISISKRAGCLRLIYDIPQGRENEFIVKAKMADARQRISAFIDTLSMKNNKSAI